jgi:hypothetical protein
MPVSMACSPDRLNGTLDRAQGRSSSGKPAADRQAVTHGTRVSVTIAAKIAATTASTARGTMPIQYAGIGSSR